MRDIENLKENVDYEWVELPSKGECYPHKKNRIKVAYLKAIDENVIYSPKYIESHTICDELLKRTIIEEDINTVQLCVGDRNAILVWLRRTGYGDIAYNSQTNQDINLSTLKHKDFKAKGDENGCFDYLLSSGDMIKYCLLTHNDEQDIINKSSDNSTEDDEDVFNELRLLILIKSTISVNGNKSKLYCRKFIKNMSDIEKENFLKHIISNTPDLDFTDIDIAIDDTLFTNIK